MCLLVCCYLLSLTCALIKAATAGTKVHTSTRAADSVHPNDAVMSFSAALASTEPKSPFLTPKLGIVIYSLRNQGHTVSGLFLMRETGKGLKLLYPS